MDADFSRGGGGGGGQFKMISGLCDMMCMVLHIHVRVVQNLIYKDNGWKIHVGFAEFPL